ncbi:MAG: hypothetical protein IJG25_00575, partial [Thermoguttaceae bacterium]|nr:hypothetical protein [Thermoguttaceae bacterium]
MTDKQKINKQKTNKDPTPPKRRRMVFLLAAALLPLLGWGFARHASGQGGCQIPNPNTKLCKEDFPLDAVISCDSLTRSDAGCRAENRGFVCEINSFPDGTVESDFGHVIQVSAPCWRKNYCIYNEASMQCEASGRSLDGW